MPGAPILIAAALPAERAALEALASGVHPIELPGLAPGALLAGEIDGHAVALLGCGVGKVAAAVATGAALALLPRLVVSVGSAAALRPGFSVGDVVLSGEVLQHDFAVAEPQGFRLFGYGAALPSQGDPLLRSPEGIVAAAVGAAKEAAVGLGVRVSRGRIATGDWFVSDVATRDAIAARTGADLVEMEGAAIAYAASRHGIPWLVIRSVSDAGDAGAAQSFDAYLDLAARNAAAIVRAILPTAPGR